MFLYQLNKLTTSARTAKIGNSVLIAIPSNDERKPNPSAEASEPKAGKQAVQLRAASQTPPEPTLSSNLFIISEYSISNIWNKFKLRT